MQNNKPDAASSVERWKRFAAAAGLDIPDGEIEVIAPALDRITAATRQALEPDLGFTPPAVSLRIPGGES